jgi:hypothetical protein
MRVLDPALIFHDPCLNEEGLLFKHSLRCHALFAPLCPGHNSDRLVKCRDAIMLEILKAPDHNSSPFQLVWCKPGVVQQ